MIILYGISNCDTIKKARAWMSATGLDYHFHDFKKDGLSSELLSSWKQHIDWQVLLNRKGTTWRKLSEAEQHFASEESGAQALMLQNPSLVKRPVVNWGIEITCGFNELDWSKHLTNIKA